MSETSDEELMRRYRQYGDETAFQVLYARYSERIYAYLYHRGAKGLDVESIFQDTFMKLHRFRERYRPDFPFAPWLFTICRNTLLDHFKKQRREEKRLQNERDEIHVREQEDPTDRVEIPESAWAELSPAQRAAVELRYGADLPFESIAMQLQKSESHVRQLVSRGIRRLRRVLSVKKSY